MTLRPYGSVATRAAAIPKAEALDEIAVEIAHYFAADGSVRSDDVIADIVKIIEAKTNYIFIKQPDDVHIPAFRMTAHERIV